MKSRNGAVQLMKPIAILCAGLGLAAFSPVHAAITSSLGASAAASVPGGVPYSDEYQESGQYASASAWDSVYENEQSSSASSSAWGNVAGVYGVGADGRGEFDASSLFAHTWSITNDTDFAQAYQFSFFVYGGYMHAGAGLQAEAGIIDYGFAAYGLDISFAGNSVYHSAVRVDSEGDVVRTGEELDGAERTEDRDGADPLQAPQYSYSWAATEFVLDLGVLNPGQSADLVYSLMAEVGGSYFFHQLPWSSETGCGGSSGQPERPVLAAAAGEGQGAEEPDEGSYYCTGTSYVWMGDPTNVNGEYLDRAPLITASQVPGNDSNDVPAPGTLALLAAAGLFAAGARIRQQRC